MTPGSRIQAAIELIDQILQAWQSERRIPADKMLDGYFKNHRYIGSKDRGAISELVYWVLRHKAEIEWWIAKLEGDLHARAMVITALMLRKDYTVHELAGLTQDSQYSLPSLTPKEVARMEMLASLPPWGGAAEREAQSDEVRSVGGKNSIDYTPHGSTSSPVGDSFRSLPPKGGAIIMPPHVRLNYPEWMDALLHESFGAKFEKAMHCLNEQAPTDLRVNTLKTTREELLATLQTEGFECSPTPQSAVGIRLAKRGPIFTSSPFKQGHFEVQDEGSQMVAELVDAKPSQKVIDFCAGAGGKTLAIAAAMKNKGRILAWDTSEKRLGQLTLRLRRAGVDNVQTHVISSEYDAFIKRHKETADRVLVDAPCSGTGTWRRNPDLKWRFSAQDLQEVMAVQQTILQSAARLVKPGGRLIYATCSILRSENERQIEEFLKNVNNFRVVCAQKVWDKSPFMGKDEPVSFLWVTPHEDGVDGFFAAVLERL